MLFADGASMEMLSELAAARGMLTFDYGMSVTAAEYAIDLLAHIRMQMRPMMMGQHVIAKTIGALFSKRGKSGGGGPRVAGVGKFDAVQDRETLKSVFGQVNRLSGGKGSGLAQSQVKTNPVPASEFMQSIRNRSRVGR